jgi:MoxR-like ATPase
MKYDKLTSITIEKLHQDFERTGYIAEDDIIVPVYLALRLEKPILITGAPGVGKTEIAKVLAAVFKTDLIRLQCYEGLDENKALYEWNWSGRRSPVHHLFPGHPRNLFLRYVKHQ